MIGLGAHFQVSGLSKQEPGSGDQVQVLVQEIWPLTTVIDSALLFISGGGWQLRGQVAGIIHSVLNAVLNSALRSKSQLCRDAVPTLPQGMHSPLLNTLSILPNRQPLTANRFHLTYV